MVKVPISGIAVISGTIVVKFLGITIKKQIIKEEVPFEQEVELMFK